MKKFKIQPYRTHYTYNQHDKSSSALFCIGGGHDIHIDKNGEEKCYCRQHSFNYEGISSLVSNSNDLRDQYFIPKRIIVIQMK